MSIEQLQGAINKYVSLKMRENNLWKGCKTAIFGLAMLVVGVGGGQNWFPWAVPPLGYMVSSAQPCFDVNTIFSLSALQQKIKSDDNSFI